MTGGHPFEREPFLDVFESNPDLVVDHLEQPQALAQLDRIRAADVAVFYDMPGIAFTRADPPAESSAPPPGYIDDFLSLLDEGKPMVFLHHAIASWPAWPAFGEIIGGRFHYQPGTLGRVSYPSSGYRHDVTHTIEVVDPTHPICAGLPERFDITDEAYLYPVLEDDVTPLLRSSHTFSEENFYSADLAIRGQRGSRDGWTHPTGSNLVGWTKMAGNSHIVYLQFGDGPKTYASPQFRMLINNAISWADGARNQPTG